MPRIVDEVMERLGLGAPFGFGLAMGGGGARGFAHVGVLKALESAGIRTGILSGVSAGSIAAVLYGAGLRPDDMLECFLEYPKFGDYTEWSIPKAGFFKLDRFASLLDSWLPVKRLEEMKIPTVVCAADLENGKSVGWMRGEIVPRVIASCSIPIVFRPVRIGGRHYVDGGVLRNLPAWAIRERCKTLIGSNCSPLRRTYKYKESMLGIGMRTYQLMAKANMLQDLNLCDIVVMSAETAHFGTFDISLMKKIVTAGYDSACRALHEAGFA